MNTTSVRISALLRAEQLVAFALFVMQNYLTAVWDLSLTHAAGIVNIWTGISKVLPVFFLLLVDAYLGNFKMLVITSMAYSVGIGFVTMSTPPVFPNSTGGCKEYKKECIGDTQKVLLHTGMALIAVGMAGNFLCIKPLIEKQKGQPDRSLTRRCLRILRIPGRAIIAFVALTGAFALPYITPWSLRFGIPACCTVIATLLFLSGSCTYQKDEPQGSPLFAIFRVFAAAASKRSQQFPEDAQWIYKKEGEEPQSFSDTRALRCLEKAAIILPDVIPEEQKKNRWKLCTVKEVEAAKIVVRMIPLATTFIFCGFVSSIGNTYFIEQANHMNRKIGGWEVPLQVLLLVFNLAKYLFAEMVKLILKKQKQNKSAPEQNERAPKQNQSAPEQNESAHEENKCAPEQNESAPAKAGIAVAMIFSVLCCITAAVVETRRLKIVRRHGLQDKTDGDDIPMSVFWLLFQYVLLAGLDSFLEPSVAAFYDEQYPRTLKNYIGVFTRAVSGLGFMFSVLSVYVVGKISEYGGKENWFQHRLNNSRLDRYYWVLTTLSSVNLVVFTLQAIYYRYKKPEAEEETGTEAPADKEAPADRKEARCSTLSLGKFLWEDTSCPKLCCCCSGLGNCCCFCGSDN